MHLCFAVVDADSSTVSARGGCFAARRRVSAEYIVRFAVRFERVRCGVVAYILYSLVCVAVAVGVGAWRPRVAGTRTDARAAAGVNVKSEGLPEKGAGEPAASDDRTTSSSHTSDSISLY